MADKPPVPPVRGSITQNADKKGDRISNISNINKTISNMQKDVNQQLDSIDRDVSNSKAISEVQSSMVKVLSKMSSAMGDIGKGFSGVAFDIGKTAKDIPSQYYKAISQEINYDKQKMLTMALSSATPIFGYFASKFMETDVWKNAAERMKSSMGNALSSVGASIKGIIPGGKKKAKIPHMAKGGVVQKAGIAKLHPAEVVMPADKLLDKLDDQISVVKDLAKISKEATLSSLAKVESYVGPTKVKKGGIFKSFLGAWREINTEYEEPMQERMLKALVSIKDAIGEEPSKMGRIYRKMLFKSPMFRNLALLTKSIAFFPKWLVAKPIYHMFKSRGGYEGHLSKSSKPLEAMSENIGLVYTGMMFRLDAISTYTKLTARTTRDLAHYFTGIRYPHIPDIKEGTWSIFGLLKTGSGWMAKKTMHLLANELEVWNQNWLAGKVRPGKRKKRWWKKIPTFGHHLEDLYGEGEEDKTVNKFIKAKHAVPVYDIYAAKKGEVTMKKLTKISEENLKQNKAVNKRQKRKSIFGLFGGIFGGITKFLSPIMTFLGPLLMGGKLLGKGLISSVSSMFIQLFKLPPFSTLTKAITGFSGRLVEKLGGFFTGNKFLSVFGKLGAVAMAGVIGWEVGRMLDNWLGISAKFQSEMEKWDKKAKELNARIDALQGHAVKAARAGGHAGLKQAEYLHLTSSLGAYGKARRKSVGFFGRAQIAAIEDGQREYMQKHLDDYLKYGMHTLNLARQAWIDVGSYIPQRMFWQDPEKYGKAREADFLKYLKSHQGKFHKLSAAEKKMRYERFEQVRNWAGETVAERSKRVGAKTWHVAKIEGGRVADKFINATKPLADLAKTKIQQAVTSNKYLHKIVNYSKEGIDKSREESQKTRQAIGANSAVISHNVHNAINTVTGGARDVVMGGLQALSKFDDRVIHGFVDGD